MKPSARWIVLAAAAAALAGCASYHVGSAVPQELRTISVPVFENLSSQPEAEVWDTQAVLAEFRRDGTMKIVAREDAALEVGGRVTTCEVAPVRYDHDRPYLAVEYRLRLTAKVRVVERATGKVVADLTTVTGEDIFQTQSDLPSSRRDALPRAAHRLAKQVVGETVGAW